MTASQLRLSDGNKNRKIRNRTKTTKSSSEYRATVRVNSPCSHVLKEENSLRWEGFVKHGDIKLGVEECGSYGWWDSGKSTEEDDVGADESQIERRRAASRKCEAHRSRHDQLCLTRMDRKKGKILHNRKWKVGHSSKWEAGCTYDLVVCLM